MASLASLQCPVIKLYGDIHRAIVVKSAGFLKESAASRRKNPGGIRRNLSLESFHDRNRTECNFTVEMRDRRTTMKKPGFISSQAQPGGAENRSTNRQKQLLRDEGKGAGNPFSRAVRSFPKLQTKVVQAFHYASSKPLPATVCLGVVVFVILAGIIKFKSAMSSKGRTVRSRILRSQWYKDSKQESGNRQSSLRWRKSPSRSFYSTSKPEASSVYDHLIIHDGEVITSHSPTKKGTSPGFILAGSEPLNSDVNERPTSTAGSQRLRDIVLRKDGTRPRSLFQKSSVDYTAKSAPQSKEDQKPGIGQDSLARERKWNSQDELDLKHRIEELHRNVQAAEANRKAAMRALAEERKRSLELEVKISRQKEAALSLEEEVRVLKESHEMLLNSLRKKYNSSVAARAAAALLYQNWEETDSDVPQSVP